jgi:hypothetical protein
VNDRNTEAGVIRYVGYDAPTGRVVHTHSQFSVRENRYVEIPVDQLKARFSGDPAIVAQLSGGDPGNLDYVQAETGDRLDGPLMVDRASRRLAPPPRLTLSADRTELTGDGQDSVDLHIAVAGPDGQVAADAAGPVRVETTRGKLSARGGLVDLSAGRAVVTLTTVSETVRQVVVRVSAESQPYVAAQLNLEFL